MKASRRLQLLALTFVMALAPTLSAQEESGYTPQPNISGEITIWGDDFIEDITQAWAQDFSSMYPDVHFHIYMRGTSTAVSALDTGVAQVGMFGRDLRPAELGSWMRLFPYPPLEFHMATGSYNVFAKSVATAILVNAKNPITKISLQQLDAIYSLDRKRGGPAPITTWGQLGVRGEWASKTIHPYGLDETTGTAEYLHDFLLKGGPWKRDIPLPPGAPTSRYKFSGRDSSATMVKAIENDPYGIGFDGFRNLDPNLKALAVSVDDKTPAITGSVQTVQDHSYPFSRMISIAVNKDPKAKWDPKIFEFVRYVLSKRGQDVLKQNNGWQPLPAREAIEQEKRLEAVR